VRIIKKYTLLLSLLLISALLIGCTQISSSKDLINDPETIDIATIGIYEDFDAEINITEKELVSSIVNLVKDINVIELPDNQLQAIIKNDRLLSSRVKYHISLKTKYEEETAIKGFVIVLQDGNLVFINPKTMGGPLIKGVVKRTASFISSEEQPEVINELINIISNIE